MKVKISIDHLITIFILLVSLDIPYINQSIPRLSVILFVLRLIILALLLIFAILNKNIPSYQYVLFLLIILFILLNTRNHGYEVTSFVKLFSAPLLLSTYVETNRNSTRIIHFLESTSILLLILIVIDILTMFMKPDGLYMTEAYSLNWFLGYKTQRFPFYLTYMIVTSILSYLKYKKISIYQIIIYLFMVIGIMKSQATNATIILIFVLLGILAMVYIQKILKIFLTLSNTIILFPIYSLLSYLVLMLNTSKFFQDILVNIFHKSATLSTRTILWKQIFYYFNRNFILGTGYLDSEYFTKKFNSIYYTNAHSLALTILLTGGIILVMLYVLLHTTILNSISNFGDKVYEGIFSIGIISMLLVGLTSSVLFFCFCDFLFYFLMRTDFSKVSKELYG